jgi:hypothetical protein
MSACDKHPSFSHYDQKSCIWLGTGQKVAQLGLYSQQFIFFVNYESVQ